MTAAVLALTMFVMGQGPESLAAAQDLYASAAYEDALAVLNRLPPASREAGEARAIEQYRAFCLLALGRTAEAEHAIEAVISGEPMYQPAGEVSPRVRTAFSDVRRRMLPAIIQQQYAQAKAAFDRKEFAAAAAGFARVLDEMGDPAAASALSQPPLSDLRTLAAGFRDLSATAAAPPPPLPAAPAQQASPAVAPPPVPAPPHVYSGDDPKVVPPIIIRQELPAYPGQPLMSRQGQLEIVIDEAGLVEWATMKQPVAVSYDNLALAATRTWRYRPASFDGVPVKFRKTIQISVKPGS